jgi:hypothetical protein
MKMKIVEVKTLENGSHRNQMGNFATIPDGWAVIPEDMELKNFPFGELVVEELEGTMTVTKWTPGIVPEVKFESEPTAQDDIDAMLIDHEYRLTLLELGVNE